MSNAEFIKRATAAVVDYFNRHVDVTDNFKLTAEDTFVVWSSKTLQNNKALISTTIPDGMYYEITYNGDKGEMYLDAYKKMHNECIKIKEDQHGFCIFWHRIRCLHHCYLLPGRNGCQADPTGK